VAAASFCAGPAADRRGMIYAQSRLRDSVLYLTLNTLNGDEITFIGTLAVRAGGGAGRDLFLHCIENLSLTS